jgi:hypothetical protein
MKTVIDLAFMAGIRTYPEWANGQQRSEIRKFADLVIDDFLARSGRYLTNDASREAAIAAAVFAERDACAKVCEGWDFVPGGHEFTPQQLTKNLTRTIAHHIRARSNT